MKLALGSQKYGSAHQLCIVYSALHMMSHASNASCVAHTQAPFIAILCLTVKIVLGIASRRGHCLQEPQTGQSCSTTTRQSSQCPLLRGKKKKENSLYKKAGRQGQRNPRPPTMPVCVPRSEGKPQAHSPGQIFWFGLFTGIVCQTPVEFLGLRSVQE